MQRTRTRVAARRTLALAQSLTVRTVGLDQEEVIAKYNKEMRLKRPCDGWPYEALFPDQASESATLRVKQEAVNNYVSIAF
jgi:hypothetical protein